MMAVGRDRPGIVAALTEVLLAHGLNVEDSQMTILGGHFTTMLIVGSTGRADVSAIEAELAAAGRRVGLELVQVAEVEQVKRQAAGSQASHVVTVYGADHPGIVHAVATALGDRDVNITDLNTRLVQGDDPLYVMMLEVAPPGGMRLEAFEHALAAVGEEQGVEVTIRPLEQDAS